MKWFLKKYIIVFDARKKNISQKMNETNSKIKTQDLPSVICFLSIGNEMKRFIKE